jgi:LAS superfamily LD-carboxypeptidase LdcB
MKKEFYLAVLMLLFCFACGNYKKNLNTETYTSTLQELNEFIEKPDDLLTQKEKDKRDLLFNLVLDKVSIKNNQFYSSATAKDFTDRRLSKYYYDILEKSIKETNQWVQNEHITNLDSMFQSSINLLFKKE